MKKSQIIYLPFKRLISIFGSVVGIIVCASLLWWWVLLINLFVTGGHPIFVHKRLGKHKKVFKLIKIRTMKVTANPNLAPENMNSDTQKSMETKFGSFLRKTSIDETTQLINILKGDMAFIGPRPGAAVNEEYLIECREKYTPNAYDVKPGMSGYAQVKTNRSHNPEQKAYYDHFYVKNISFELDFKTFVHTIFHMFGIMKGR